MAIRQPFMPDYTRGQVLSPAAGSAVASIGKGSKQMACTNLGAAVCYVRTGFAAGLAATTADYPIPAGAQVVITKDEEHDTLAHISATGTTLHVIPGEGW